jgi:hypothetical protein
MAVAPGQAPVGPRPARGDHPRPARPLQQALERLFEASKSDHMRKLRGLYVDYADGDVLVPSVIPEEEARQLIDDVQMALSFLMNS